MTTLPIQPSQTSAETADLLLYGQQHEDWLVPFAEWCVKRLDALRATPWIFDVANVHPSWLPVLAVLLHADAYIAGVYDEEYERRVILESSNMNRYRGKPHAVDCLALAAQFLWDFQYTFDGVRVSGVNLFITPSVGANQSNAQWQAYVTRVCNALLPLGLPVNSVAIAQRFEHTTRLAADYESLDWEVTDSGGLTTSFSLL